MSRDNWENVLDSLTNVAPSKSRGGKGPIISDSNRGLSGVCDSLVCADSLVKYVLVELNILMRAYSSICPQIT